MTESHDATFFKNIFPMKDSDSSSSQPTYILALEPSNNSEPTSDIEQITEHFPLYSFSKNKQGIVQTVLHMESLDEQFQLPLSVEAYNEFCELLMFLQSLHGIYGKDTWSYIWGSSDFSAAKAYQHLIGSNQVHPSFQWLWAT
jgi:hypothetical protein